jgi:hypothetical protein
MGTVGNRSKLKQQKTAWFRIIDTGGKFAACVVDTGGNLPTVSLTPAANLTSSLL